ncbi:MAG: C-GCAxxG-C-C family protein [Muribaculaceae bacterium]|nr:C-GCAxxG-C-C family protein [Muribaculaceae bacterium]
MVENNILEKRLSAVAGLRASGHNCAQCVMLAFADRYASRMSAEAAEAVACALGGGVCGTGHICGAASAMAAVVSLMRYEVPSDKKAVYAEGAGLIGEFARRQGGLTDCDDLRRPGAKSCGDLINDAVEILSKHLQEDDAR